MKLIEVRCRGCGRLLGRFEGKGSVKCPKVGCGGTNVFDTDTGDHRFIPKPVGIDLKDRKTSSGVTYWVKNSRPER